jgi:hypothetical protein
MKIDRNESIILASFIELFNLDEQEYQSLLESALAEYGVFTNAEEQKNKLLQKYIAEKYSNFQNSYIQKVISKIFKNVHVTGIEPRLFACPCCNYKNLKAQGEYFICQICNWEDDGTKKETKLSAVNGMTLEEGKKNFKEFGAVNKAVLRFLDEDRFDQFSQ